MSELSGFELNRKLLLERVNTLNKKNCVIIAFDFDELIVTSNLTATLSSILLPDRDAPKNSISYQKLLDMDSQYKDVILEDYYSALEKVAESSFFNHGFESLIKSLNDNYNLIIITSGFRDACYQKLGPLGLSRNQIIGSELEIFWDEIIGSKLVVSKEAKGFVISLLKNQENILISVGHSDGDQDMLTESNFSISYNSSNIIADCIVDGVEELRKKIIEKIDYFNNRSG